MNILKFLFPARCVLCGKILREEKLYICPSCRNEAPFVKEQRLGNNIPFLSGNTSVFYYEGKVRAAIIRMKYGNRPQYAAAFGAILAEALKQQNEKEPFDVIAWVPAHRARTWRRGFNQAELLAREVSKELNVPARGILTRTRRTKAQSGLRPSQRKANVLGAFNCAGKAEALGRVLLIDDILTTGATASECARVLLAAKCREVYLATAAKTRKLKNY